jgi:hypothetical protein
MSRQRCPQPQWGLMPIWREHGLSSHQHQPFAPNLGLTDRSSAISCSQQRRGFRPSGESCFVDSSSKSSSKWMSSEDEWTDYEVLYCISDRITVYYCRPRNRIMWTKLESHGQKPSRHYATSWPPRCSHPRSPPNQLRESPFLPENSRIIVACCFETNP